MILWKFKEQPETRTSDLWPCKAFRWVIDANFTHLGVYHQYQMKRTGEWITSHSTLYEVCVNRKWCWGSQHIWYDGAHCSFSIGLIHFNWFTWNCKKCIKGIYD